MLITESYLEQNRNLHEKGNFGVSGYKWADSVTWFVHAHGIQSILDYGAGQQTLKRALEPKIDVQVSCYDPAVLELSLAPRPAELVTCTDVLEHVELENLEFVLDHIKDLAQRYVFLVIPTGPAAKFLPDGRNAHLIQKPVEWWLPKLMARFKILTLHCASNEVVFFGSAKPQKNEPIEESLLEILNRKSSAGLQSVTFDGVYWRLCYKNRRLTSRVLPRILSILKFGKKMGVSERKRQPKVIPKYEITEF